MEKRVGRALEQGYFAAGVSGIRGSTLIMNLPGSERAARENLDVILPALGHGIAKLRGDPSDCGRPPVSGGTEAR